jgi:hypothetical protein
LRLRDVMRRESLLNKFLEIIDSDGSQEWFLKNARMFLDVCDAHGRTAAQHHDQLVSKYIVAPAGELPEEFLQNLTASGPPLDVLLRSLEKLRDLRLASDRADIQRLREKVASG